MAMKEVDKLLQELSGTIVISSDHGNLMGEYMRFGHIPHLRVKNLVKVPWFVIKNEMRKEIIEDLDKSKMTKIKEMELIKKKIKHFHKEGKI